MSRIQDLVRQLQSGGEVQQAEAAEELGILAEAGPQNCAAIAQAGGIEPLVRLLDSSDNVVVREAATALAILIKDSPERSSATAGAGSTWCAC